MNDNATGPTPPQSVTLAGREYAVDRELVLRKAVRKELGLAYGKNDHRGCAAILGLMVPALGMSREYAAFDTNALAYGAAVWEKLIELDVDDAELLAAGRAFLPWLTAGLRWGARPKTTRAEVDEARGFSSAPGETTS
jgi:hypothetical protein